MRFNMMYLPLEFAKVLPVLQMLRSKVHTHYVDNEKGGWFWWSEKKNIKRLARKNTHTHTLVHIHEWMKSSRAFANILKKRSNHANVETNASKTSSASCRFIVRIATSTLFSISEPLAPHAVCNLLTDGLVAHPLHSERQCR